ncbi:MAG: alginate lyase family protein, partial [Bacteroidales bacterium]|nr:alginate lyase family protein [Bacteroidales bacterium]
MKRLHFFRTAGMLSIFLIILPAISIHCHRQGEETISGSVHPLLILEKNDVEAIKKGILKYTLLNESFHASRQIADKAIEEGISVPVPKDPGGGYTHELHKNNYVAMYHAGLVYQLTGEKKYALFVRDMLLQYADLYPALGLHPESRGSGPGKLFWQGLNESVWLVYTIQAYDCVYDFISPDDRKKIEAQLFHKMVSFFTEEDSYSFNRIHNHGTWTVAGVGMTGLVLDEQKYVEMALYGTRLDSTGGFMRQINDLFSPDGFYSEGPYYQRYAIMPFIIFAKALDNNRPGSGIFEYKDGVLAKAVTTLIQLTDNNGRFYPLNDAMKEKSLDSPELVYATNIAYSLTGHQELLAAARQSGHVMLS